MTDVSERRCCASIRKVLHVCESAGVACVTQLQAFHVNCLNLSVIQLAYYEQHDRPQLGQLQTPVHEYVCHFLFIIIIINVNLYSALSFKEPLNMRWMRYSSVRTKTSLTVVWMFRDWGRRISSNPGVSSTLSVLHIQMHVCLRLPYCKGVRRVDCGPMTADDDVLQTPKQTGTVRTGTMAPWRKHRKT